MREREGGIARSSRRMRVREEEGKKSRRMSLASCNGEKCRRAEESVAASCMLLRAAIFAASEVP